ncbi:TetR family transcriptional regulator [Melittangium boletus]|uniref:SasN n=1 Tax=Melittangium boletus DSM 14713 TaxID=1294270 RepID=A0A250IHE8_9BACT|nr:TetR family transcriptional regulator [Melittangium boletus]ATB31239.1 SasN [Melittangium boletus DSM 14713]
MKRACFSLLLCLVLGTPVWAASGLDAPRTEAQEARARVRELREHQQALRAELNTLAGRIEQLKAEQKGRLVAGPELQGALRQSQELSGQLTGLAQSLAGAESDAERKNLTLHTALSAELDRVRAAWDATSDRQARAGLIARMRALRTERDALRSALPPSQVLAPPSLATSDDSEDLLEQADALRDSEDKVRERLKTLRARLTEVREERELDRRMSDFLGEESMFDEQDRRLNLRVDGSGTVSVNATPRLGGGGLFSSREEAIPTLPDLTVGDSSPIPPANPPPSPGAPGTGGGVGGNPGPSEPPGSSHSPPPRVSHQASDSRPQVGTVRAQALASDAVDDVRALEQEAARLESLARELGARAGSLERRARELR